MSCINLRICATSLEFTITSGDPPIRLFYSGQAGIIPMRSAADYIVYTGLDTDSSRGIEVNDGMNPVEVARLMQSAPTEAISW